MSSTKAPSKGVPNVPKDPWAGSNTMGISPLAIRARLNILCRKYYQLDRENPDLLPLLIPLPEDTEDEINWLCQEEDFDWKGGSWHSGNMSLQDEEAASNTSRSWGADDEELPETEHVEHASSSASEDPELSWVEQQKLRLHNVLDDDAEDRSRDRLEAILCMQLYVEELLDRRTKERAPQRKAKKNFLASRPPRQYLREPWNASEIEQEDATEERTSADQETTTDEDTSMGNDAPEEKDASMEDTFQENVPGGSKHSHQ